MTTNEIVSTIKNIPGATMARVNKGNYIVIPSEDGYVKVKVTEALNKETKNHKPFNFDAAVAEYQAWEAQAALREAERAAKPKRPVGPSPEAQAKRDALDAAIKGLSSFTNATATDVFNQLPETVKPKVVMPIGQSLQRLVADGVVTMEIIDKKKYYTKA